MVGIDPAAEWLTGGEGEWRYRILVAASSDVVYRMSADWGEMRSLIGREFIADTGSPSRTWLEKYIHPDDQPTVRRDIDRAIQTKSVFELEHRVIRTDGTLGWTHSRAVPLLDGEGKIAEWIGTAVDVSERKRGEATLRESEARLQAAIDLVKLGCYSWNPQSNELRWDDTLKAMWGLPAGATVDYDVWRFCVHPDDLARVDAAVKSCTDPSGDEVYDIEYRVIGKTDGAERWIATRGQTHFENGVAASFYGVALDVTDRKNIEMALERRVEARTRELEQANRQLRSEVEQREIAEAEVQQLQRLDAIGQITSGVAHDFNNLLSVVLTNTRMLSRNLRDPGDQEGIELIRGAAERGVNLTSQLLAFSRQQRLEPKEVDLNSTIVKMGSLLNASLSGTIQLRTNLAADLGQPW
jgi:PAS domain S-box-containing protein